MPRHRPYNWSPKAGRYRDPVTGRFVSLPAVRKAIDGALDNAEKEVRRLADRLRTRSVTLGEWELEMRRLTKDISLYSAAAAKGGWAQLNQADLGRIGVEVRRQYGFLRDFSARIATGATPLDGRFAQYSVMYAREGRALYHSFEMSVHEARGIKRYRNVLHPADHCEGCLAQSARGFVALGKLVPIGSRTCRSNDRCSYEYEDAPA